MIDADTRDRLLIRSLALLGLTAILYEDLGLKIPEPSEDWVAAGRDMYVRHGEDIIEERLRDASIDLAKDMETTAFELWQTLADTRVR